MVSRHGAAMVLAGKAVGATFHGLYSLFAPAVCYCISQSRNRGIDVLVNHSNAWRRDTGVDDYTGVYY